MRSILKVTFVSFSLSFIQLRAHDLENMERTLKQKKVIITGGATGLGYEIGNHFLKNDAEVIIILDINEKLGNNAVKQLNEKYGKNKAAFIKCDVTQDLEDVYGKIINTFKVIDVFVNNAGILDESDIQKTININVTALIKWSFKFFEHMRRDKSGKGGAIINISSLYGYQIEPYFPVYHASKFAVMGFTRSLGHIDNFRKFGVRVLAICPGYTETALISDIKPRISECADEFKEFAKYQIWQKSDAVGKAAVDVFSTGDSGTAWLIEGGKPIKQI